MNNPLVSVIVPNYNYAQYLDQRMESILSQTYQNFEVIILALMKLIAVLHLNNGSAVSMKLLVILSGLQKVTTTVLLISLRH